MGKWRRKKKTFFFIFFDKKKNSNLLIVQIFLILKRDPINVDCVWPQRSARENK